MTHKVAERVINKLGGARAVAGMLGMTTQAIYRWMKPTEEGGAGGLIPMKRQLELMVAAKQRGLELSHEDFYPSLGAKKKK
jgi:predicted DNA-binding transcriptional regulator AlpA